MIDPNKHTNDRLGDLVDAADAAYQIHLEAKIKEIASQPINTSNPGRSCWQCGEETPTVNHRWCSPECRDDWCEENE